MTRARSGMTFVEALMAAALGALVAVAVVGLTSTLGRMGRASDLAGAMQEAGIAMALMQEDLTQAVQKADPSVPTPVLVRRDSFQLIRASFLPDGAVKGQIVTYRAMGTAGGNFRLVRRAEGEDRPIPGIFRAVVFNQYEASGGPYVRVTLRVAAQDVQIAPGQAQGSEEAVLSSIVRVMGPEGIESTLSSWPFLSGLDALKLKFDF